MFKKALLVVITGIMIIVGLTIKNIEASSTGALITFKDNTGYYIGK